jgi:hypothetical protein
MSLVLTTSLGSRGFVSNRKKLQDQARETPRQFVQRESHFLWGQRRLLSVIHSEAKLTVTLGHQRITLTPA